MPRESGVIAGARYAAFAGHRLTGDRESSALARAVAVDLKLDVARVQRGARVRAQGTITNIGAGHEVPTGDPAHRLELRMSVVDERGKTPRGVAAESLWLGREVGADPPFLELSNSSLSPGARRSLDYSFTPSKRSRPGQWTLRVEVYWWSVPKEQIRELGLAQDQAVRKVLERRIPIDVL